MSKRRSLGRGLDALLAGSQQPQPVNTDPSTSGDPQTPQAPAVTGGADAGTASGSVAQERPPGSGLAEVPVDQVYRGQYQPRRHFDEAALDDLAQSIRSQGLMQPIVLRSRGAGGYEIVAGERRWRAAQRAGLTVVPALIREVDDEHAMAMALIENIQREDLNPLEEATAMQRLRDEFELTQQQLADTLGKSRVAVANTLRLLNLAAGARAMLAEGELEMGHARALLSLAPQQQDSLAREVAARGLTVRATEARVRQLQGGAVTRVTKVAPEKDPDVRRLEQRLAETVGAPVSIDSDAKGRGRLVISYSTLAELDGILNHIN